MTATEILPLELVGVSMVWGRSVGLRGVDLRVDAGEVVGLWGPNGAGKTTLLGIAAGLLQPSAGERRLGGSGAANVTLEQRGALGFVAHTTQTYPLLTARENLEMFAALRRAAGLPVDDPTPWLERLGLAPRRDDLVQTFSRGMAQRLAVARALAGHPQLLLLDEPFTALDAEGRGLLSGELRRHAAAGGGALVSSHDLETLVEVTDRVLVLRAGVLRGEARRGDERRGDGGGEAYRGRILGLA